MKSYKLSSVSFSVLLFSLLCLSDYALGLSATTPDCPAVENVKKAIFNPANHYDNYFPEVTLYISSPLLVEEHYWTVEIPMLISAEPYKHVDEALQSIYSLKTIKPDIYKSYYECFYSKSLTPNYHVAVVSNPNDLVFSHTTS